MKLTLIASLLYAPLATGQSLEQAVADTLATNPEIKRAYNEFMSRNESTRSSVGDYLPSVDLEATAGYEDYDNTTNSTGDYEPLDATISLRQLIWDGSITYHDIQRNKAEAEAQRYQLLADAQDKALRVTEIYLDTLEAQEVLALSQTNFAVHQRIFTDIKKRTDSGIGSTADLAQIEGRLARSRSNLIAAENNLQDKITEFYREVGSPPVNLEKPEVDQNYIPTSLENAISEAKDKNPVLYVARNDIDAANYQYKQAKGGFYPTFSIEASQEWGEDIDGTPGHTDEFKAMLKMEYNLYNGGSDLAESRRAAYQLNQSKDVRDRAYRLLEESTRLAWSGMELALNQILYLQKHVDASARTVIAYEKQFRIGKRTLLDVLNTENELFEARKAYLDAHYAGILVKYRVLNSTGLLLEEMRVDVPNQWSESVR
ncbi:TolC family outer membrane protein [Photobacterium sp. ZSDE20]|uniref:TolC family outer membrane protein n=1 Tax=Photobacterium pectinilyticum TaxID=2906793 RepID=A0ABT1N1T5_9GAMM|nr:TolC family outer membrane protein [Photobacterium sp. ZSDE20]MCQ1058696.1 TolC family outer membrane protein [Photobacterium sp. ZSDE20]MDD1823410.1 TolC family outer membrane protein [Photobacterium sp. ZSDE20]